MKFSESTLEDKKSFTIKICSSQAELLFLQLNPPFRIQWEPHFYLFFFDDKSGNDGCAFVSFCFLFFYYFQCSKAKALDDIER
jgi:hypothetical protein